HDHHREPHAIPTRRSSDLQDIDAAEFSASARWKGSGPADEKQIKQADKEVNLFMPQPHQLLRARNQLGKLQVARADDGSNGPQLDRKSTRLNSSHQIISYA